MVQEAADREPAEQQRRRHCADGSFEVEDIMKTYDGHVEAVLHDVKILISTVDAANTLFANLA